MRENKPLLRIAIVEDRKEDLESLRDLVSSSPGFECLAACRNGEEALEELPRVEPDIVLMDIKLPGLSGIDCVSKLTRLLPSTQFMMLTALEDHELIFQSLAAGATGYLLKKTSPGKILEAIRELQAGGAPMSGQVARKVVAAFREPQVETDTESDLSPSEQNVLHKLARGLLYKEVAEEMNIAISTVRTHVWHIYRKLQVHNRTEAILKFQRRG